MNAPAPQPEWPRAFTQERAQVLARDAKSGQLRYLPDKQGNDQMEPGVTWRAHVADGMLLCPMPGCGPFGRVVAAGDRRHHFAHPTGAGNHHHGTGPETLWHLSAKEVLRRWAQSHPRLREWTLRIDDTPITRQDRWRRPDVLAIAPDGTAKLAFEVQYSALTGTEWKARHDFYAEAGVIDIWLFAHHGTQWTQASAGQRRDLARSDPGWVATVKLNGLHQKMLTHGVIPLWLDPTAQKVGTATARFHPATGRPGKHLGKSTAYSLPPLDTFPACNVAADALQQCDVDLDARELLTPARRVQREEHKRFLTDRQAAQERAARSQARRRAEQEEATRRRREAEQEKRRATAAQWEAEQEKRDRLAEEEQLREQEERDRLAQEERLREEEARAAAEARERMLLSQEYPPVFEQDPPQTATAPWWQPWRRRT